MRDAFFYINFLLSILLMAACATAVGGMESVFGFLGGVVLLPLAASFAGAEWIAWYHHKQGMERGLAVACLFLAAFAAYMVILTISDLSRREWASEDRWFVFSGCAIAVYFMAC